MLTARVNVTGLKSCMRNVVKFLSHGANAFWIRTAITYAVSGSSHSFKSRIVSQMAPSLLVACYRNKYVSKIDNVKERETGEAKQKMDQCIMNYDNGRFLEVQISNR